MHANTPRRVSWPLSEPERILVAGDWHGNQHAVDRAFAAGESAGAELILQLGDFGMWPGHEGAWYLEHVRDVVAQTGIPLAWIDGNHEDFDQLYTYPIDPGTGLRVIADRFWHLPRTSRWQWHQRTWCALGGATSLDRPHRTPGRSWWAQEAIDETELAAYIRDGDVDVLLTHDCPSVVHIPGIMHRDPTPSRFWPQAELEIAWDHRDRLAEAVTATQPGHILHGHFHLFHDQTVELPERPAGQRGRDCRIVGLADDSSPGRNLAVVDIRDMKIELVS